jgi:hypothetical protein
MVGRDRELARVMLLLDDALMGGSRLVLCTGEAGIGKTRLAEAAAASAAARGVPVAWARGADRGSLPPYGLWRPLQPGVLHHHRALERLHVDRGAQPHPGLPELALGHRDRLRGQCLGPSARRTTPTP